MKRVFMISGIVLFLFISCNPSDPDSDRPDSYPRKAIREINKCLSDKSFLDKEILLQDGQLEEEDSALSTQYLVVDVESDSYYQQLSKFNAAKDIIKLLDKYENDTTTPSDVIYDILKFKLSMDSLSKQDLKLTYKIWDEVEK